LIYRYRDFRVNYRGLLVRLQRVEWV